MPRLVPHRREGFYAAEAPRSGAAEPEADEAPVPLAVSAESVRAVQHVMELLAQMRPGACDSFRTPHSALKNTERRAGARLLGIF